ncbi:hypothetical protein ACH4LT_31690 [Streptomyces clavifer]
MAVPDFFDEKRKEAPGGARIDASQVRRLAELFAGGPWRWNSTAASR